MEYAVATTSPMLPAAYTPSVSRLVEVFLSGKAKTTLKAYANDLRDFSTFIGVSTVEQASELLLSRGHGGANELALAFRSNLLERGLSSATVNRRLAALRSLVQLARVIGLVSWTLELPGVKAEKYRETQGCGLNGFKTILHQTDGDSSPKTLRDRMALRLMWDLGLRREEVVSLDVADVNLVAGTLSILGKGRRDRETLTLPQSTAAAIQSWLDVRGSEPGALVTNCDRNTKVKGRRLSGGGLYRVVQTLGSRVGVVARPHGIRHASITEALDKTNGNVRAVQRFSRHRDVRTLAIYDDNRADLGGSVAALVAGAA